jgi:serine phosphatase RsbU (regulator of sigma subunit)
MKRLLSICFFLLSFTGFGQKAIDSLLKRSEAYYNTNLDSVFIVLEKAFQVAENAENPSSKAAVSCAIIDYASYSGNFDLGKEYFDKAFPAVNDDKTSQANLLIAFADLQKTTGMFDGAVESLMKAEVIADSLNLNNQKYRILELLSNVFMLKTDYEKALDYANISLGVAKTLDDKNKIGWSYARIANTQLAQKNYVGAETNYKQAIATFHQLGDKNSKAQMVNNLGLLYQEQRKLEEAEKCFLEAYNISKEINYFVLQVYIEAELGDFYRVKKDYNKAQFYFDLALKNEKEANYATLSQSLYYNIHEFYKEIKDYDKSLFYFEKYSRLTDSLSKKNQDQRILETETKFRTREKQREIESQQAQIKRGEVIFIISCIVILIIGGLGIALQRSRKKQIVSNKMLAHKNSEIEHQKKEIVDSINYAKRIQDASLGHPEKIKEIYPNSAILFQPKDILSGDFYWFTKQENKFMFSVADCTGHGVPGAMMSMIGNNGLNDAVNIKKLSNPADVLFHLSQYVNQNFIKKDFDVKDGMDIAFCSLDLEAGILEYSGALNSLFICRKTGDFQEIKADKSYIGQLNSKFNTQVIQLEPGDSVYVMSDGLVDQFGGPKNKKFKLSNFREIVKTIFHLNAGEQLEQLKNSVNNWKQNSEQTDDICLLIVKF